MSLCQNGEDIISKWHFFSKRSQVDIYSLQDNLLTKAHIKLLKKSPVTHIESNHLKQCIFQQDNAKLHISHIDLDQFLKWKIDLINFPARFPKLEHND